MPTEFKGMTEEERLDFEKRLANYGLEASALIKDELTTVPSTITPLCIGQVVQSRFNPVTLKTADFDQVNRWIGMPDEVAEQADSIVDAPKPLRFLGVNLRKTAVELPERDALAKLKLEDLSSEHLTTIRTAAKAYLYGDSRKYKAFKPWIEKLFPAIEIHIWPFLNVTVKAGSVLEFGPGPHVLVAHTLTIEEGGIIRSYGHLKVDAVITRKTIPLTAIAVNPALLVSSFKQFRQ